MLPLVGDTIEYFIASNEVEWDYAPHGQDMCGSEPQPFSDDAAAQLIANNYTLTIGSKQMKAVFEEYTDATFTTKKVHLICWNSTGWLALTIWQ